MTAPSILTRSPAEAPLIVQPIAFSDIARDVWDRLQAANPAATPFSRWTFHRAWWDAYGDRASDLYLRVTDATVSDEGAVAILPLMARHGPSTGTVDGASLKSAATLYMGASYHADYATILARPSDMPRVVDAILELLEDGGDGLPVWHRLDLRRLRASDPFLTSLLAGLRDRTAETGWTVREEIEDVCPVVSLAEDWEAHLSRLGKKARHEIRRKLRRAERHGVPTLRYLPLEPGSVDLFVDLHQARWEDRGLFADGHVGERNLRFLHRLVELERAEDDGRGLHLASVDIGGQPIHALVGFAGGGTCYFYNAGMDPERLDLSPGVVGTAVYLRDRIEAGDRRFDFLRGDEEYKYQWGATDEPVHRVVVERDQEP